MTTQPDLTQIANAIDKLPSDDRAVLPYVCGYLTSAVLALAEEHSDCHDAGCRLCRPIASGMAMLAALEFRTTDAVPPELV
jgi:hypothetical protein